jgi:hypothetical protein
MKSIIVTSIAASSLFAGLAIAEPPSYTVIDLGTLGGTYSYGYGINNAGWVSGGGCEPDPDRRRVPNRLPLEQGKRYAGPRHTGRTKQRGGRT